MSKENEKKPAAQPKTQVAGLPNNVVQLPVKCLDEECKKRPERAGFCSTHFVWFKEGLLTKEGKRPRDFDKKYISFLQKTQKAS